MPKLIWRLVEVEEVIIGHDNEVRGAQVKVAKTSTVV